MGIGFERSVIHNSILLFYKDHHRLLMMSSRECFNVSMMIYCMCVPFTNAALTLIAMIELAGPVSFSYMPVTRMPMTDRSRSHVATPTHTCRSIRSCNAAVSVSV
jgi:hypothetical protein